MAARLKFENAIHPRIAISKTAATISIRFMRLISKKRARQSWPKMEFGDFDLNCVCVSLLDIADVDGVTAGFERACYLDGLTGKLFRLGLVIQLIDLLLCLAV